MPLANKKNKIIAIRVAPRSSRNELIKITETDWRVKLTAPAIEGRANQALMVFLSAKLGIKNNKIEIVRGLKSRDKVIKLLE